MKRAKIKKKILFIIFWLILIVSFIFSASLIILKANGYQLNYKKWQIIKTGMIILDGTGNTEINLNGQDLKRGLPIKLANLTPGNYELIISKKDYQDWQRQVRVEAGKAVNFSNITLFLVEPVETDLPNNTSLAQLTQESQNINNDLKFEGTEIFYQDKFVTRFSQNVLAAGIYADQKHLIFQQANEIRIIELDGSNNTLLFRLSSNEPTLFSFRNNGQIIIFLDNGQIKARTIY